MIETSCAPRGESRWQRSGRDGVLAPLALPLTLRALPMALAVAVLVAASLCSPTSAHARGGMKWIGLQHDMKVNGIYGRGERWGKGGNQFLFSFEASGFAKTSSNGNLAGLEFTGLVGYDSTPFAPGDGVLGDTIGVPIEISFGFPVTLFNWVRGSNSLLMIGFAPGVGISWMSAFTYLKLKGAGRIGRNMVAELQWIWWPGAASAPFGNENRPINAASLRASVYFGTRKGAFEVFAELYESQREDEVFASSGGGNQPAVKGGNQSKQLFAGQDPFGATERYDFENFFRIGVGYAF
jgi:hypothetical protein